MRPQTSAFSIMLADPPLREEPYSYLHPTFGLLYLAGAVRKAFARTDVDLVYQNGFCSLEQHLRAIEEYKPHLYAISFKTPLARLACQTTNAVRAAFPNLPIIAGGVHSTAMPEDVLENSSVDACFRGECEQAFVDLIATWRGGRYRFENCAGAVFRQGGEYVHNCAPPLTKDINELAWPAWDLVDNSVFPGMAYERKPALGVVVSRGCPWKCTFCSEPIWKINGSPTFRARTPEDIALEVEYLYQRGIREVRLWCEELNVNVKWACEVLEAIARLDHHDLFLNSNIRSDRMTPELADAMRNANLRLVCTGIESGSQRTLDALLKDCRKEEIENSCAILRSRGIKVLGYFLLYPAWETDGHLEFEDTHAALQTIRYALQLHQRGLLDYMSIGIATPRPSTPMWDTAKKYGLFRIPSTRPFYYVAEGMSLPGISRAEIRSTLLYARSVQAWIAMRTGGYEWRTFSEGLRKFIKPRRVR